MYLGIDLGTAELKVVLVDPERQCTVASAGAKLEMSRPRPQWSEQAPAAWVQALHETLGTSASCESPPPQHEKAAH